MKQYQPHKITALPGSVVMLCSHSCLVATRPRVWYCMLLHDEVCLYYALQVTKYSYKEASGDYHYKQSYLIY